MPQALATIEVQLACAAKTLRLQRMTNRVSENGSRDRVAMADTQQQLNPLSDRPHQLTKECS